MPVWKRVVDRENGGGAVVPTVAYGAAGDDGTCKGDAGDRGGLGVYRY